MSQKLILFYSVFCPHCRAFEKTLDQTQYRSAFRRACIDPVPGTKKRPPWVKKYQKSFLKEVPTIIVGKNIYSGDIAFKWLEKTTNVSPGNGGSSGGGTSVAAFKEDEMIDNDNQFVFIKRNGKYELPIGDREYLEHEKPPPLQRKDDNSQIMQRGLPPGQKPPEQPGKNNWSSVNINKSLDEGDFKRRISDDPNRQISNGNSLNYNPGEFKPVRPQKRPINFQLPQMSDSRRDASSELEQRMAELQAEREPSSGPMPGGNNRMFRNN